MEVSRCWPTLSLSERDLRSKKIMTKTGKDEEERQMLVDTVSRIKDIKYLHTNVNMISLIL